VLFSASLASTLPNITGEPARVRLPLRA
jgi:hypothetical protein